MFHCVPHILNVTICISSSGVCIKSIASLDPWKQALVCSEIINTLYYTDESEDTFSCKTALVLKSQHTTSLWILIRCALPQGNILILFINHKDWSYVVNIGKNCASYFVESNVCGHSKGFFCFSFMWSAIDI